MVKLFDLDNAIQYFRDQQLHIKFIINYENKNHIHFDKLCMITQVPNTIDALSLTNVEFAEWYEQACKVNSQFAPDYWACKKFYVDLVIRKNDKTKFSYSNKFIPYHIESSKLN